jgi:hypothetical protein
MTIETYSAIQLEAKALVVDKASDLVEAHGYGSLINNWTGRTSPVLIEAAHNLGTEVLRLTTDYSDREEAMTQEELEALRIVYGITDKRLTFDLLRNLHDWKDQATQSNHVIARLGKNTTHLALSMLNHHRRFIPRHQYYSSDFVKNAAPNPLCL